MIVYTNAYLLLLWALLLLLPFCTKGINVSSLSDFSSNNDGFVDPSYIEVSEAIRVLQSIGMEDLCHPTIMEYDPILPVCNSLEYTSNNLIKMHKSNLRTINKKRGMLEEEKETKNVSTKSILVNSLGALLCIIFAALAAGLTMGMVSIAAFDLHVKIRTAASEVERQQALTLVPIIEQRHRLLVTLLLLNSLANEALPLFLDELVPSLAAVMLSVTFVLFFGEIIPSAVFTGPQQMKIAAMCVPFVKFIMCLFTPLAVPVAKLLDYVLGHDDKNYDRDELSALVRVNYEMRNTVVGQHSKSRKSLQLNSTSSRFTTKLDSMFDTSIVLDEIVMMEGALQMKTITAGDIMKPVGEVYTLQHDLILSREAILKIYLSGYSRIPVYDSSGSATHICGVLLSKQLMVVEPDHQRTLSSMPLQQPLCVPPNMNLVDLLNIFQEGRMAFKGGGHLAVVCENPNLALLSLEQSSYIPTEANVLGIITLEDVLEELLQEEIRDETDFKEMSDLNVSRQVVDKWRMFIKKKKLKRGEDVGHSNGHIRFDTLLTSSMTKTIQRAGNNKDETIPLLNDSGILASYNEP